MVTKVENLPESEYEGLTITPDTPNVIFTKADGITPGDPNNIETGDIVIYGDFEYHYNQRYDWREISMKMYWDWWNDEKNEGWGVKATENKAEYGDFCGNIFGKNLVNMTYTFSFHDDTNGLLVESNIEKSPKIPKSVKNMQGAFYNGVYLVNAPIIPNGVTDISWAFLECSSLKNITIPESVTSIGMSAFGNCSNLTSIIIPESVMSIEHRAFSNCSSLTSIIIPESVTSIGSEVFYGCSNLTTINLEAASIPSGWNSYWKGDCTATVNLGVKM